jgi:ribose transport system substrate-binding protein
MKRTIATRLAVATAATAVAGGLVAGSLTTASSAKVTGSAASASSTLKAYVKNALKRPTSINITTKLGAPIPAGKTIDWLQCGSPACVTLGTDLQQATAAVGWKLNIIQAGLTPESVKAAWDQAVQQKPSAVWASGFPRVLFNPELAALKADGIPVLDMTTADPPGNGLTAVFDYGPDYYSSGKLLADYALTHRGGKTVNSVSINVSAFPNLAYVQTGFQKELKAQCAKCTTSTLLVPATSIGTDLPTRVATYLQANPTVNWVYIGYADMMDGVPAALASAGISSSVKFVTIDSSPTTATYIKANNALVATDGFPGPEIMWRGVDLLMRHFDHKSTAVDTAHNLPVWLVTSTDIPSTTSYFPLVAGYQAQYKKLWGLG